MAATQSKNHFWLLVGLACLVTVAVIFTINGWWQSLVVPLLAGLVGFARKTATETKPDIPAIVADEKAKVLATPTVDVVASLDAVTQSNINAIKSNAIDNAVDEAIQLARDNHVDARSAKSGGQKGC